MSVCQLILDEDWHSSIFILKFLLQRSNLCLWDFQAWPAIPLEGCSLRKTTETCDQSSRGHAESVRAIVGAFDGYGESVGYQEQSARALGFFDSSRHFVKCCRGPRVRGSVESLSGFREGV